MKGSNISVKTLNICLGGKEGANKERYRRENNLSIFRISPSRNVLFILVSPPEPHPGCLAQCLAPNKCSMNELNDVK